MQHAAAKSSHEDRGNRDEREQKVATTTGEVPAFVDTHAHLDDAVFDLDRPEVIRRSAAAGVSRIVNIGYRPSRWSTTIDLANRCPGISVVIGLHPQQAEEFDDTTCDQIADLIQANNVRAIGEIGLDYARDFAPPERQQKAFAAQLELAVTLKRPVVIHQRAAAGDCGDMLRSIAPDHPVILHCFDGSPSLARLGLDRGYYFGIGGLLTRPAGDNLRAVFASLLLDRLVLETDAPYMTPAGANARRNEPANIPLIADRIAEIHGISSEEIARLTTRNAERAFSLSPVVLDADRSATASGSHEGD
jgi:TatD DNase family protein